MSNLFYILINEGEQLLLKKLRLTQVMGILFIIYNMTVFFIRRSLWECCKKLASRSWTVLFTLTDFFLINTFFFCYKIKSCYDRCFLQQIRPQTTVQWYMLQKYSSLRIGFNITNKRHTLPVVYTLLV